MRNPIRTIIGIPRNIILALIALYQCTLSPDHGPLRHVHPFGYCRHHPTCSQYAQEQIEKNGVMLGGLQAMMRILTCHPWRQPDAERIRRAIDSL